MAADDVYFPRMTLLVLPGGWEDMVVRMVTRTQQAAWSPQARGFADADHEVLVTITTRRRVLSLGDSK